VMSALGDLWPDKRVAHLIVLHWAQWAIEAFAKTMAARCRPPIALAADGAEVLPGHVYLFPADVHMTVEQGPADQAPRFVRVERDPVNFVRPSADVLFASMARTFGPRAAAVVLSGPGCDGARGAARVASAGGTVVVQDPDSAVDRSMPESVLRLDLHAMKMQPSGLPTILRTLADTLAG
jgi:two-component system, chemotaxis family, protein-glutamate methylesterase/glutaminase